MQREANYYVRYSECLAMPGSGIWPKCDITRRQRPMRALVSFTIQGNLEANMCRTQLLDYSPQPACSSSRVVGFISTLFLSS